MFFSRVIAAFGLVSLAVSTGGLSQEPQLASLAGAFAISGLPAQLDDEAGLVSRPGPNSLSARVLRLQTRADDPDPTRYGPLMSEAQARNCVTCPDPSDLELDGRQLLAKLNTRQMRAYMRGDPAELHNKCVFYTRPEQRAGAPERLSGRATEWACNRNKFSIWHLWPNALMARSDSSRWKDFFGIYEDGNWLKKIQQLPRYISPPHPETQYFENMSEAMAQTCTGEVVIMTEDPLNFKKFSQRPNNLYNDAGNIWGNKERPALRNSFRNNRAGPFYLVDVTTWSTGNENFPVYDYDIVTQVVTRRTTSPWRVATTSTDDEGRSNSTDTKEVNLEKRACERSNGLESERQGYDYFAGLYPLQ